MNNSIYPCFWFDGKAKEAADFYCSIFPDSKIQFENPVVVQFEIAGKRIMALNGGPMFSVNASISLFVTCESEQEIDTLWQQLSTNGKALMELNEYPWSKKYGWVADRYGITWQLMLGNMPAEGQKITTSFLFSEKAYGKAQEAVERYTSLFPNSRIQNLQLYGPGDVQTEGKVMFCQFSLDGETMVAMDGPGDHFFSFNEGVSLVVSCKAQDDIDHYWDSLTRDGAPSRCGWLKDAFGVSWQIVPDALGKLMSDPEKFPRVMQKVMQMDKLDIATMENA